MAGCWRNDDDNFKQFILANGREWDGLWYWRDKPVGEHGVARNILEAAGVQVDGLKSLDQDPPDCEATLEGRAEIESRLREFLRLPFEVIDHRAAIRPVIDAGFPVLLRHPDHPQLAYFNGLGSKGALLAPYFAEELAARLTENRGPNP